MATGSNIHTLRTRSAPGPSQTLTLTTVPDAPSSSNSTEATSSSPVRPSIGGQPVLRLRGAPAPSRRSVSWAADVIDNEGLGRKKSKVCCIYRRPRAVDESSDESSSNSDSSSSSDSDSDCDDGPSRKSKQPAKHTHDDHDGHNHNGQCSHSARKRRREGEYKHDSQRQPSPNAYERMPKNKPRDDGPSTTTPTA